MHANKHIMQQDNSALQINKGFAPAEPLWKRVPTRDKNGNLLSDFLMLIPQLGKQPRSVIEKKILSLQLVLQHYSDVVVFADLNLKLNTLWISLKPIPGKSLELATAIKFHLPDAVLVAQRID